MTTLDTLFESIVSRRPGASDSEIAAVEDRCGQALPDDFKAVLRESDGLEGFVAPDAYLVIWSTHEIQPLNEEYAVAEFLPGVILIGTDGGDTGYGFVQAEEGGAMAVSVPLIGMAPSELMILGRTFWELLIRLRGDIAPAT